VEPILSLFFTKNATDPICPVKSITTTLPIYQDTHILVKDDIDFTLSTCGSFPWHGMFKDLSEAIRDEQRRVVCL